MDSSLVLGYNGKFKWVLGTFWDMFGNCLELSTTDNKYINQKNGTKSGTCLGSVGDF